MLEPMKVVTLVALVAMASCAKAEERKVAKTTEPSDGLELVSAGASSARKPLRYHLQKGAKSPLELVMNLELEAGGRGGKLPSLVMALEIGVDDVLPDGGAKVRTTVTGATAREREGTVVPASMMDSMTSMLEGMAFTATLSPDGSLRDSKFELTKPIPPTMKSQVAQLTQNLEQVAMRLPEVALGVGAKWTARKTVQQNGLDMVTLTTVEITAIDGDRVTFTSNSTVSAPDQTVIDGGETVTIKDVGGGGTGKGTIDLSRMTMTGEFTAEFRGMMSAKGETAPMRMAMKMTMAPMAAQGAHNAP